MERDLEVVKVLEEKLAVGTRWLGSEIAKIYSDNIESMEVVSETMHTSSIDFSIHGNSEHPDNDVVKVFHVGYWYEVVDTEVLHQYIAEGTTFAYESDSDKEAYEKYKSEGRVEVEPYPILYVMVRCGTEEYGPEEECSTGEEVHKELTKLIGDEFSEDDIIAAFGDHHVKGESEVLVEKCNDNYYDYYACINSRFAKDTFYIKLNSDDELERVDHKKNN